MPENKISILILYGFPLLLIGIGNFLSFQFFKKMNLKSLVTRNHHFFFFLFFLIQGYGSLKKFAFQDDYSAFLISDELRDMQIDFNT